MKKTTSAGDAARATTLQALRAGPLTSMEMTERWPFGTLYAAEMRRVGLVEQVEDEWRITPAGRAACPFRNPQAATAAAPEIFTMPKGEARLTHQQVLAAIRAAGPDGLGRAELVAEFSHLASEQSVDMHLVALGRAQPAVVFKPMRGQFVAIEHRGADAEIGQKTASTATDDWEPESLATDPPGAVDVHGVSLAVEHHEAVGLPTPSLAAQMAQIGGALPAIVEDIRLNDPDTVEFAIYSSGGLDIFSEDCAITLDRPVLAKLRGFLGLFQEAI